MQCQKSIQKLIQKMMKKTYCTHINLNLEAAVFTGIPIFAENRAIKNTMECLTPYYFRLKT